MLQGEVHLLRNAVRASVFVRRETSDLGVICGNARVRIEVHRSCPGNYRHIARCIRVAGVDTSHFKRSPLDDVADGLLAEHVRTSRSVAQVLSKLNLPVDGRPHRTLTRRIKALGFDTSHFTGPGWTRGMTAESNATLEQARQKRMIPDDVVFSENSPAFVSAKNLTKRLIALGREYACAWCGISEWRGVPLVLHNDHINGINNDNRLPNLRFLCPNCHSQTPTYGNRRR
jgi:hypothetical protein